jgi:hypothetical protein
LSTSVKASAVNWLPWSVLKICGRPKRLLQGVDAEVAGERVVGAPGRHLAAVEVQDRRSMLTPLSR